MQQLTIVVPCYNEEAALPFFMEAMEKEKEALFAMNVETTLLFVNDGSSDGTLPFLRKLAEGDEKAQYLSFSRNFGKEAAMYAGLVHAAGDFVVVMDADLQDPPALLPQMIQLLREKEIDCVATRRVTRKGEPPIRSFFARQFYRLINRISKTEIVDGARDYRMMSRRMVDAILSVKEYNRFSKGLFGWVGFTTHWLEYENINRVAGETKWSFWKLFFYSIDGIVAYSTLPLSLSTVLGAFLFLLSFLLIGVALFFGSPFSGYAPIIAVICLIGGLQLLCLGILGAYLSKTYLEAKHRPIYIAKEKGNLPEKNV